MDELDDYWPATEETVLLPLSGLWRRTPHPDAEGLMPGHLARTGRAIGPIREEAKSRADKATFMVYRTDRPFSKYDCCCHATLADLQDIEELSVAAGVWCRELLETLRAVFRTASSEVLDATRAFLAAPHDRSLSTMHVPAALLVWPRLVFRNTAMGLRHARMHLTEAGWAAAEAVYNRPLRAGGVDHTEWHEPAVLFCAELEAEAAWRLAHLPAPLSASCRKTGRL